MIAVVRIVVEVVVEACMHTKNLLLKQSAATWELDFSASL
jgi:hypothetical protein